MNRSKQKFAELYEESFSLVYNYLYARTFDAYLAEDVAAEAFTLAWRSFYKYDPSRAKFSTWVITIARNALSSHFRLVRDATSVDDIPEGVFATNDDDEMARKDQVRTLLGVLSEEERELVYLRYWQEMSPAEIGELVEMNPSTVRTRLHRAMERMRRVM